MKYTKEEADKAVKFVRHIKNHLSDTQVVICKICKKTIDEIEIGQK